MRQSWSSVLNLPAPFDGGFFVDAKALPRAAVIEDRVVELLAREGSVLSSGGPSRFASWLHDDRLPGWLLSSEPIIISSSISSQGPLLI